MPHVNLTERLKIDEALSQVWFVHDYIQLQFQDKTVTVLNVPTLTIPDGRSIHRSDIGFCDALVALIDQPLVSVSEDEEVAITLRFGDGTCLAIPLHGKDAKGPEAMEVGPYIFFNA